jgi:hypothetical protein
MDANFIRSLTEAGAKVMIFSGANSGVMRSDIKSVDSMPSDEVLDRRRQELNRSILAVRKSILELGAFPTNVAFLTDPTNPFPKIVRDWWVQDETTRDIAHFFCYCGLADGSETGWSNGFLGSRWADTIINKLRLRIAFYTREKDPKYFASIERQNCGITGKHQYLFIFNTLYFQEDETHRTLIFATPEEEKERSQKILDAYPDRTPAHNLNIWKQIWEVVRSTKQTIAIHDDEDRFAKTRADLGSASRPFYECVLCDDEFEGYGNNPYPVKREGVCCDSCNMTRVIPARFAQHQEDEMRERVSYIRMTKEDKERLERERDERERQAEKEAEERKKYAEETKRRQAKEEEERKKREKAEAKRLAEATRADREEAERKKKAELEAKKQSEADEHIKRMDEGKLKAFLKTIPARPPKTVRDTAGCVKDNSQKQKQWDEKWGQYKKYMK